MKKGIVYFLQEREFLETDVYKIGRTQNIKNRLSNYSNYSKGTKLIFCLEVLDEIKTEKHMLSVF